MHRFLITALAVSSKALCDAFCTNVHYAKVGGIRVAEFNLLEREFLSQIEWRLTCTRELLQTYYVNLVRTHSTSKFRLLDPPEPLPQSPEEADAEVGADDIEASSPAEIDAAMSDVSFKAQSSNGSATSVGAHSRITKDGLGTDNNNTMISTHPIGSPTKQVMPKTHSHSTSTGLVPPEALHTASATMRSSSPPRPTLEQNMAFASLISSNSNPQVEGLSSAELESLRVSKRALQLPDEPPDDLRPPVRRRVDGETSSA